MAIVAAFFLVDGMAAGAALTNTGASLDVEGPGACNNNGICEINLGENSVDCLADCPIPVCDNDGTCDAGETTANCPDDCPAPVVPPAVTPAGSSGNTGDFAIILINDLSVINIAVNSAEIIWTTNQKSLCQVHYGENQDYKAGVVTETGYGTIHNAKISGLLAGTAYNFKITCRDDSGKKFAETENRQFTTVALPDTIPPANISNFEAAAYDGRVELKWNNPSDSDFDGVRIVRSEKFYPQDPGAGLPVYEGKNESFSDYPLVNGITYYYTAFANDKSGNMASGAITRATPQKPGELPVKEPIVTLTPAPPEIDNLKLEYFNFIQKGAAIGLQDEVKVVASGINPITIALPYGKVPEVLKTMMVTLEKGNKEFSFLLRADKDKTFYQATLVPPDPGIYPFTITIFDYKNQAFKKIKGQLEVAKEQTCPPVAAVESEPQASPIPFFLMLLAVLVIIHLAVKIKKNKRKTPNTRPIQPIA